MKRMEHMIRTKEDLINLVEEWGFLPYFANEIKGFSIEEQIAPELWFGDQEGAWEWKGPVIQTAGCAYGKFFGKKAAYISKAWFPDFANYRRDGYVFDARYEDGLASRRDWDLFQLVDASGPILSKELKRLGNYRKGGTPGFDTCMTRLQSQCYVLISNFVYLRDKWGRPYGWGVAEYATPEQFMGSDFTERVYTRAPEESFQRILAHLKQLLPEAEEKTLKKLIG